MLFEVDIEGRQKEFARAMIEGEQVTIWVQDGDGVYQPLNLQINGMNRFEGSKFCYGGTYFQDGQKRGSFMIHPQRDGNLYLFTPVG